MTTTQGVPPICQWCGLMHGKLCPAVKAIEYHQNGAVKRVEFKMPADEARGDDSLFGRIFGKPDYRL